MAKVLRRRPLASIGTHAPKVVEATLAASQWPGVHRIKDGVAKLTGGLLCNLT